MGDDATSLARDLRDPDAHVVEDAVSRIVDHADRIDLSATELVDAIVHVLRSAREHVEALADVLPHAPAYDDAFLAVARLRVRGGDGSVAATAYAYLAASPSVDHARVALDWFIAHLSHGKMPRGFDIRTAERLVGNAPELAERAWSAILAFLDAGPSTDTSRNEREANALYRDMFTAMAPRLPSNRAWAIARNGLARLDPEWGSQTRYVLNAELPRHAGTVGMAALDDVMAAMAPWRSRALTAILSLASHPTVNRAAVLSRVLPAIIAEQTSPTLAAAAVRALAPDADPVALGLPREIAARWKIVALTETTIRRVLSETGILPGDASLSPPVDREPKFGSELVEDVLLRAGVLHHFDAEDGFVPVHYRELLAELAALVRGVAIEIEVAAKRTDDTVHYDLVLAAGGVRATVRFADGSDYFDVSRVLDLFDDLLGQLGMVERFTELSTSDQTAMVMWGPPAAVKKAAGKLGLKLRRRK